MLQDRRAFLALSGSTLATFFLTGDPEQVRAALRHAQEMVEHPGEAAWEYLTPEQAADVEAFASQIVPSEPDSPGAKEAGVVYFVDKSLATWAKDQRDPFTKGLDALNLEVGKHFPGTARFANLSSSQQTEILRAQEKTEFFQVMRASTLMGFLSNPEYGGNKDKIGWKLLGFEDRYAWQPPFGDYDAQAAKGASR